MKSFSESVDQISTPNFAKSFFMQWLSRKERKKRANQISLLAADNYDTFSFLYTIFCAIILFGLKVSFAGKYLLVKTLFPNK